MTDHLTVHLTAHNEALVDAVCQILERNHALGILRYGLSPELHDRLRRLRSELHAGTDYSPVGTSCPCFRCRMRSYPATPPLVRAAP